MATVFLRNDNIKVKVPVGITLQQVAQKTGASMGFGCRSGDCTTCFALVEQGMEYLNAITPQEIKALEILGEKMDGKRLMCQCTVESPEGEIIISYL